MRKLGRAARAVIAVVALLSSVQMQSCVGKRGHTCYVNSDCESGSFCADSGFCDSECRADRDCPCGSHCEAGCGLCVRDDLQGPATCFPYQRGLDTNEVLGVCAVKPTTTTQSGAGGAGPDEERLCAPNASQPQCLASPPSGGSAGSGGVSGSGGSGGQGGAEEPTGGTAGDGGTTGGSGPLGGGPNGGTPTDLAGQGGLP
jgi:hypothetical protein